MPLVSTTRSPAEVEALVDEALSVPIHRFLNLRRLQLADGEAKFELVVDARSATPTGTLHGGVLSLVLEIAAYAALIPLIPRDKVPTTIDFHNQPMRSIREGERVRITGRVLRHGRRQAFCEVETHVDGGLMSKGMILKALLDGPAIRTP